MERAGIQTVEKSGRVVFDVASPRVLLRLHIAALIDVRYINIIAVVDRVEPISSFVGTVLKVA